jgi:hypothetical protein
MATPRQPMTQYSRGMTSRQLRGEHNGAGHVTSCTVSGRACWWTTEQGRGVSRSVARVAAVADRRVTDLSPQVSAELVAGPGPRWQARQDAHLADRPRLRATGSVEGVGWCSSTGCTAHRGFSLPPERGISVADL